MEWDPVLSKVLQYTRQLWPAEVTEELKPYFNRREELTLEGNCLLWGIESSCAQTLARISTGGVAP